MVANLLIKIIANAGALWAAVRYIEGLGLAPAEFLRLSFFPIDPLVQTFIAGGAALAILNAVLYPFLKVIGDILPFITAAMLMAAANMALLYLADAYFAQLAISGIKPLFWSGLLLGVVNTLL